MFTFVGAIVYTVQCLCMCVSAWCFTSLGYAVAAAVCYTREGLHLLDVWMFSFFYCHVFQGQQRSGHRICLLSVVITASHNFLLWQFRPCHCYIPACLRPSQCLRCDLTNVRLMRTSHWGVWAQQMEWLINLLSFVFSLVDSVSLSIFILCCFSVLIGKWQWVANHLNLNRCSLHLYIWSWSCIFVSPMTD